jgi:hypothetical protein
MQTLQPAPTLKDLRNHINEAIAIAGEDAIWNGFNDEALYIYHPTDSSKWVAIFPIDGIYSSKNGSRRPLCLLTNNM